ncbi:OTU domain-containing protein At3g57810-like isoform X2 [Dendrobium catenatum]|uniref:OTU domain-containing protein At3g57810-like isoform X2 n=1 Tax=Dendrobium catenatum TaxID=906689 RepID=UPI00109F04ED|nr:OTU domain-containing protein At3g57810-like isoform X2 [Dendrobium catenatum]
MIQANQILSLPCFFITITCKFPKDVSFLSSGAHCAQGSDRTMFGNDLPPLRSIRIPGDGRCLFRAVTHGACLRAGKPTPSENLQKELADELRNKVADEFIQRRAETEW